MIRVYFHRWLHERHPDGPVQPISDYLFALDLKVVPRVGETVTWSGGDDPKIIIEQLAEAIEKPVLDARVFADAGGP